MERWQGALSCLLLRKACGDPACRSLFYCPLGGAGEEEEARGASAAGLPGWKAQVCSQAHGEHGGLD